MKTKYQKNDNDELKKKYRKKINLLYIEDQQEPSHIPGRRTAQKR